MRLRLPGFFALAALLHGSAVHGADAPATALESQRAAFRAAYAEAERGNWQPAAAQASTLRDYVLWPDLRGAFLRATASRRDDADIRAYLDRYRTTRPARELRYRYVLELAAAGRYADYLTLYEQFYRQLNIARLDCIALQAEIAADRTDTVANRALALWLIGSSQRPECEPVFNYLRARGLLGVEQYRQRYALAIAARRFKLARYLSAPLSPAYREQATRWLQAQEHPAEFLRQAGGQPDTETRRLQIAYATEQLARRDPGQAAVYWSVLGPQFAFDARQMAQLARHLALWSARRQQPESLRDLQRLPPMAIDAEVRRWTVRSHLRQQDWHGALQSIGALADAEQAAEQWQYWRGMALARLGRQDEARAVFSPLAAERSYYGFLAADELDTGYAFAHRPVTADEAELSALSRRADLVRARELFLVGLEGRGRAEWDDAVGDFSAERKIQAALLAHRWGWHSRAIATVATVGHFDDLRIRYPLPYASAFRSYSADAQIMPSWAYGIARSESLFMRDIRSSAGAIGVMQLLPETGRRTAKLIQLPYAGLVTLTDPDSNIRLGTVYLGRMLQRFDENRVLATAAYNAGPLNVQAWLPQSGSLDARIWIETIPFDETRKYVRRVLATDTIFHWRMTGEVRRLSSTLPAVAASVSSLALRAAAD